MSLYSWLQSSFKQLLRLNSSQKKILILGLDNAGKTTFLHKITKRFFIQHVPTQHPNKEVLKYNGIEYKIIDLGGHQMARQEWVKYFDEVDGVIYLVDSNDHERLIESKNELEKLLNNFDLACVPFLILVNKCDLLNHSNEINFREKLGLSKRLKTKKAQSGKIRPIEVFMCSVSEDRGYAEGLNWLSKCFAWKK